MKKYFLIVLVITFSNAAIAQDAATPPLQPVLQAYFALTDALAKDQSDSAQIAAGTLFEAIEKVPMDKLSAEQHKVWMQHYKKMSADAEHIKATADIGHQREHFATLSANMSKLLKAADHQESNLYIQFCPMTAGGKGAYWISEQQKISNPYMGKRMPTCGRTAEVLKATE